MIHRALPRRPRRAGRVALALATVSALLTLDGRDASATPPTGVTAVADAGPVTARVGALFSGGLDGGHFCTASVVRSAGRDLIATAAHCLGQPLSTVFVPGYRDGSAPYGVWRLTGVTQDPSWTDGADPDADIAFATLAPLEGRAIEDVVGGFPLATDAPAGVPVTVVGYPSTVDEPLTCSNDTTMAGPTQRRIDCPDLAGGTSGSPWLAGGALAGVLGGFEGGGTEDDVSYSAVLGDLAERLYRRAAAAH
ncbi:trypsin-like serine peptidase [Streptomyces antimicrobicus]|uniref:Trypsin-like serine protease n=1 Tax=Streptomyces antimicrobicus TaxID=2883108 RepID=A0ABS8B3R7_9ACTN|nr:trypsin-like serine protease [Streptomyces antimicrobicus]MCB5179257.1 trypsin-like serine protease [Streptomyces antimicrobicus]